MHLIVDGVSLDTLFAEKLENLLIMVAEKIKMTRYGKPQMIYFAGGWSGVQWVAESHIIVNCIGRQVWVDVCSCKQFEPERIKKFVVDYLRLNDVQSMIVLRMELNVSGIS